MEKKVTNEDLARMVAKGFEGVDRRFNEMVTKSDLSSVKIDLENKINKLEVGLSDIKDSIIPKLDFEDLEGRVGYIEKKLDIVSGK